MKQSTIAAATLAAISLMSAPITFAHEAGDWLMRAGATSVQPDDSSSVISTTATGPLAGTSAGVDNSTQLGLNLVYMYTDNLGVEVLAATPFEHDIVANGLQNYGFATHRLASTKQLPPTVSALYFFGTGQQRLRPYLGLGLNYTTFFSEDLTRGARTELAASGLELDDSWGLSYRAGFDFELDDQWMLNASLWKIDIDTDASFRSALGTVKVSADLDPWVYMISLGYKF